MTENTIVAALVLGYIAVSAVLIRMHLAERHESIKKARGET